VELVFEVEVASVDVLLAFLVDPLEHPVGLLALIEIALKLVLRRALLACAVEQVLEEVPLVGDSARLVPAHSLRHVVVEVPVVDEPAGSEVDAVAFGLPLLELPHVEGSVGLVHPAVSVRVLSVLNLIS
jgi:hypothetical protein